MHFGNFWNDTLQQKNPILVKASRTVDTEKYHLLLRPIYVRTSLRLIRIFVYVMIARFSGFRNCNLK